ncbi:SH3 domain-containing protein [Pseudoduganella sp.]|uniref:SH3 domain-containing protein n=1 Tax=Pseudoduganella sp. TaxID=1880898 RepID=UPI0035B07A05
MDAYLPFAAYLGGLAATLVLACYLTPSRWWHRPTLRNLGLVAAGTWCIGALLLQAFGGKAAAQAASEPAAPAAAVAAVARSAAAADVAADNRPFRVHRDLNLRVAAGTGAARLATIPAGTLVTPTGIRSGDWWQVRAETDGRMQTGWASSLWLRRQAE